MASIYCPRKPDLSFYDVNSIRHYAETQSEIRKRVKSSGDFSSHALCGNGNYHIHLTREKTLVNCQSCIEKLEVK